MANESKKNGHYLTRKEEQAIAKYNRKVVKTFEAKKRQKNVAEELYLTKMKDPKNVVEFEDLHTYFYTSAGTLKAVDGVTFSIPANSTVGVVGESGCGKSVTSLSLMQLVQAPQGQVVSGSIRYNSGEKCYDIAKMPTEAMRHIRGKEISMIFQEPMTSLNPVFTIGLQLDEVTLLHTPGATKAEAKAKSIDMLKMVGIARAEGVYSNYPHELSGGMRQRVMIAMALICNPKLIIADEPTTALDVTIQAQILELLRSVREAINGSIMLITHDLGVVAEMADFVVVMYAGRIIEMGTATEIFLNPKHPYTIGLMQSKPVVNKKVDRLYSIPGQVPNPIDMPNYCYFSDRCEKRCSACDGDYPIIRKFGETHSVACHLYDNIEQKNNGKTSVSRNTITNGKTIISKKDDVKKKNGGNKS